MSHGIIKFNEAAALKAGLPKDLVNTIRHLVASIGSELGQMTLPEVVAGVGEMGLRPLPLDTPSFDDPLHPAYSYQIPVDYLSPPEQALRQVEYLQTEVRQMAEQITALQQQINDLNQGKP